MPNLWDLSDIKVGNININEVYAGSDLVWRRSEYQFPYNGLIGYYKLDGNSKDEAQYANLINSNVSFSDISKIGKSGYFNGSTSNLETTDNYYAFEYNNSFSFSFWINPSDLSSDQGVLGNQLPSNTYRGYFVRIRSVKTISLLFISDYSVSPKKEYRVTTQNSVPIDEWTNVVITYNGSTAEIYFNGIQQAYDINSDNLSETMIPNNKFRIGNRSNDNNYFEGYLDEIGIWDRVLNEDEIEALYNHGEGLTYNREFQRTNLVAWFDKYVNNNIDIHTLNENDPINSIDNIVGTVNNNLDCIKTDGTPIYKNQGIKFADDGSTTGFSLHSDIAFQNTEWTMFMVLSERNTATGNIVGGATNSYALRVVPYSDPDRNKYFNFKIYVGSVNSYTGPELEQPSDTIVVAMRNDTYMGNRWNGGAYEVYEEVTRYPTVASTRLGYGTQEPDVKYSGTLKEMLFYNKRLSTDEIEDIENYLSTKYSIELNTPGVIENGLVTLYHNNRVVYESKANYIFKYFDVDVEALTGETDNMDLSQVLVSENRIYTIIEKKTWPGHKLWIYYTDDVGENYTLIKSFTDADFYNSNWFYVNSSMKANRIGFFMIRSEQSDGDDKFYIYRIDDDSVVLETSFDDVTYAGSISLLDDGKLYILTNQYAYIRIYDTTNGSYTNVDVYNDIVDNDGAGPAILLASKKDNKITLGLQGSASKSQKAVLSINNGDSFACSLYPVQNCDLEYTRGMKICVADTSNSYYISYDGSSYEFRHWNLNLSDAHTVKTITGYDESVDSYLMNLYFTNASIGYVITGYSIFKTTDGTTNWTKKYFDNSNGNFNTHILDEPNINLVSTYNIDELNTIWNNSETLLNKVNKLYDKVVDLIQTDLPLYQKRKIIEWLENLNVEDLTIKTYINNILMLLQ